MPDAQRIVIRIKKGTDGRSAKLFEQWDAVEPGNALEVVLDLASRTGSTLPVAVSYLLI